MKIAASRVAAFVRRPDPRARAVLVYGPDRGGVREAADALAATACQDPRDPFRVTELAAAAVEGDPARLADEAAALPFGGGRRVVRVRDGGDRLADAFRRFLEDPAGDALVVVEAGELPPKSELRRLFEAAEGAAALPCYADEGEGLEGIIRETLAREGLDAEADAIAYLVANLGSDRLVTRGELAKLALYMGDERRVTLADAEAGVGDSAGHAHLALAFAAALGDAAGVERIVAKALAAGTDAVALLRTAMQHFQRLHLAAGVLAETGSPEAAMAALRPPVFYKERESFRRQLLRWSPGALARALDLFLRAEAECKATGLPAEAVARFALLRVARLAPAPEPPRRR